VLNDLLTVLRKELLEIVMPEGRFRGAAKNLVILIGIAGLLFPLQAGPRWLTSWISIYSACFPAILLLNYAADTFAGERERHTLETLLASRLPDAAILLGKVFAIVGFGWALILLSQVLAVIGLTVVYGKGRLLFFDPAIALSLVVIAAVLPLLLTTLGALLSMTAPTVRSAGQRMLMPFLVIYGLPSAVPFLLSRFGWTPNVEAIAPVTVVAGVAVAGTVLSAILLVVAMRLFERETLVLS
jgi:ABC-2 type transport system permease protein